MRRAALLLIILTSLCNGCAAVPPPAPVVLATRPCPAPEAPQLPAVDGAMPFDNPANVSALLQRDSVLRRYMAGLTAALACYDAQTEGGQHAR